MLCYGCHQGEGGDNHALPEFFHGLRAITKEHGVAFIVDEVMCYAAWPVQFHPCGGSIRFRPLVCTYAPWYARAWSVRADEQT